MITFELPTFYKSCEAACACARVGRFEAAKLALEDARDARKRGEGFDSALTYAERVVAACMSVRQGAR